MQGAENLGQPLQVPVEWCSRLWARTGVGPATAASRKIAKIRFSMRAAYALSAGRKQGGRRVFKRSGYRFAWRKRAKYNAVTAP
jgi:hypothetical protein